MINVSMWFSFHIHVFGTIKYFLLLLIILLLWAKILLLLRRVLQTPHPSPSHTPACPHHSTRNPPPPTPTPPRGPSLNHQIVTIVYAGSTFTNNCFFTCQKKNCFPSVLRSILYRCYFEYALKNNPCSKII